MVNYWKNQQAIDVAIAFFLAIGSMKASNFGFPTLLVIDSETIIIASRTWVGPILTLLGMMSATTAFVFSVVDRDEFKVLKRSKSASQLWQVFAENILWLSVSSISAAVISFQQPGKINGFIYFYAIFLFILLSICILKFAWVMRQIISVRIT